MKRLISALMAAVALSGASTVSAQISADATARAIVPQVLYVAAGDIDFGTVTAVDFEAGDTKVDITVTHRGNVVHDISLKANAPVMTSGSLTKPVSDILWKPAKGPWEPMTTSDALITDNAPRGNQQTDMRFRILLDYASDRPGTYTVGVTFTVVAS